MNREAKDNINTNDIVTFINPNQPTTASVSGLLNTSATQGLNNVFMKGQDKEEVKNDTNTTGTTLIHRKHRMIASSQASSNANHLHQGFTLPSLIPALEANNEVSNTSPSDTDTRRTKNIGKRKRANTEDLEGHVRFEPPLTESGDNGDNNITTATGEASGTSAINKLDIGSSDEGGKPMKRHIRPTAATVVGYWTGYSGGDDGSSKLFNPYNWQTWGVADLRHEITRRREANATLNDWFAAEKHQPRKLKLKDLRHVFEKLLAREGSTTTDNSSLIPNSTTTTGGTTGSGGTDKVAVSTESSDRSSLSGVFEVPSKIRLINVLLSDLFRDRWMTASQMENQTDLWEDVESAFSTPSEYSSLVVDHPAFSDSLAASLLSSRFYSMDRLRKEWNILLSMYRKADKKYRDNKSSGNYHDIRDGNPPFDEGKDELLYLFLYLEKLNDENLNYYINQGIFVSGNGDGVTITGGGGGVGGAPGSITGSSQSHVSHRSKGTSSNDVSGGDGSKLQHDDNQLQNKLTHAVSVQQLEGMKLHEIEKGEMLIDNIKASLDNLRRQRREAKIVVLSILNDGSSDAEEANEVLEETEMLLNRKKDLLNKIRLKMDKLVKDYTSK